MLDLIMIVFLDLNGKRNGHKIFQYKFWTKLVICKSRGLQPFADIYIIADLGFFYIKSPSKSYE